MPMPRIRTCARTSTTSSTPGRATRCRRCTSASAGNTSERTPPQTCAFLCGAHHGPRGGLHMFARLMRTTDDGVATLLRLVLGVVFFPHGAQKVLGWFGGYGFHATLQGMSKMLPAWLVVLVMLAEFAGSLGPIVGFPTRIAAFGIRCVAVGALPTVHRKSRALRNRSGKRPSE